MAMRQHGDARGGRASSTGAVGRHSGSSHGGGSPFEGGLFGPGGRDPFAEFGRMEPFGAGGFGGGFGSIMKQFDEMARGMDSSRSGGGMNGIGGSGSHNMGNGQYACQSFAMCSRVGSDGKVHTERFANSEVGNRSHGIREAQQAYHNSSTGIDKMGLERQLGDKGRKVVRERNRHTMEERSTELFKGMDEAGREDFDRSFGARAQHLPQHPRFDPKALAAGAPSGMALPQSGGHGHGHGQLATRHGSVPSRRR